MTKTKAKRYPPSLLELMAAKTALLMKARTFADMGMAETAQPMWVAAASHSRNHGTRQSRSYAGDNHTW